MFAWESDTAQTRGGDWKYLPGTRTEVQSVFNLAVKNGGKGTVYSGAVVLDAFVTGSVADTTQNLNQNISWAIAELIYLLIAVLFMIMLIFRIGSVWLMRRTYMGEAYKGVSVYSIPQSQSPASFFNMIFMPENTDEYNRQLILRHEVVHARQWHSLDVLFYEIVKALCWFNPVVYLLEKELRLVHEYIADSVAGNEKKAAYSKALLAYNMGVPTHLLTNNFYQPSTIKSRIIMLQKTTSMKSTLIRLVVIVPMFLAFSFFNSVRAQSNESTPTAVSVKGDDIQVMKEVEKMPEFKGGTDGLIAYLSKEIVYPEIAREKGVEGNIVVQFVVDKEWNVRDAVVIKGASAPLDEEALRVVNAMPRWTPGENEGQKVNVQMVLPISFKLPAEKQK